MTTATDAPRAPVKAPKPPREQDPHNPHFRLAALFDEGTLELITEDDGSGMLCNDVTYTCGCRSITHMFHDGSCRTRIVRHDGRVLLNELSAEHAE